MKRSGENEVSASLWLVSNRLLKQSHLCVPFPQVWAALPSLRLHLSWTKTVSDGVRRAVGVVRISLCHAQCNVCVYCEEEIQFYVSK